MRERLVLAFVALAVGIIALYGIPRAYIVADLIQTSEERRVVRLADFLAVLMAEREAEGEVTEEFLEPLLISGEHIVYVGADGTRVQAGEEPADDDIVATAEIEGGGSVEFGRSNELISGRVQEAVMPVVVIGVALMIASAVVGVVLARRLSRPFTRLAGAARDLGTGSLAPEPADLRIPEARAIDQALRASATTLEQRIRREHEFAANASHQLRTPITALRLELEDLSLWPETPPPVRAQLEHALREIDRLSDAIGQLLELARGATPGSDAWTPLGPMLEQAGRRWTAQAVSQRREIRVESARVADVTAPAPTTQILDVLLHNALQHGRGRVTVSAARANGYVTVSVADEGQRPSGNAIFQRRAGKSTGGGEGIGLALSAELAEALGGHLLLDSSPTTRFSLILPQR
ncbi:histidine kinase dimerization/phospho-acceptor domain-containing protein [Microbacterium sp. M3]|uniref:histidine kinase n=1 Tax=Microbacterium arthrosphaerae TaxID=792652 RepID=A0ABU4H2X0_9MICO|nr:MULTISPECIES: histidine kinase dimerization/phospho-acceptor domain-containing protein [Microbacterium]MDW4573681.1 histidine kinase dimerization/phospho-acceptor domain-containing protein [Microbacterium arthrosphaerae]MDW7607536.1 histidine kinase dimerization/phospho-acceptor domain-containing protein [Microbacterium sp. M3]